MNLPDNVTREELFAMVIWLAGYQDKLNDLRRQAIDECRPSGGRTPEADVIQYVKLYKKVMLEWPIIQGSQHQIWLKRIGELEFDNAACGRALEELGSHAAQEAFIRLLEPPQTGEEKP